MVDKMKRTVPIRLAIGIAFLCLLLSSVFADDFEDALKAYDSGDYKTAYRLLVNEANTKKTARAQFNLGVIYAKGQGVMQDYKEALKWYKLAAEQGYVMAQNNLGAMSEYVNDFETLPVRI